MLPVYFISSYLYFKKQSKDFSDLEEKRYYTGEVQIPEAITENTAACDTKIAENTYERVRLAYNGEIDVESFDISYTDADGNKQSVAYDLKVYETESADRFRVLGRGEMHISILVENMGRVSYGHELKDYKGITESVRLGQTFLFNWEAYPLELNDFSQVEFKSDADMIFFDQPTFYKAQFIIEEMPADTFIKLPSFTKGMIFINGRPLSRYWSKGPQKSAYLPAPFLIQGINEIIVFELEGFKKGKTNPVAVLDDKPELNG